MDSSTFSRIHAHDGHNHSKILHADHDTADFFITNSSDSSISTLHTDSHSLDDDNETSNLLPPSLKDHTTISLRALEDGEIDLDDAELTSSYDFWTRLLMTLRMRHTARSTDHHPVRLGSSKLELENQQSRSWKRQNTCCRVLLAVPLVVLCFFGIAHLINIALGIVHPVWDDQDFALPANWQFSSTEVLDQDFLVNLTKDVVPIPCHSHNDYWRRIPLYEALRYGCTGVEADVWLFDNELFVGHSTNALQEGRTFRSMYVDRLVQLLDQQNIGNRFTNPNSTMLNGIFPSQPSQTLVLLVDFKNYGPDIYPVVSSQLSALREKNYLTYYDGERLHQGPITVVATGNAPFDLINAKSSHREIFFDAPLDRMYEDPVNNRLWAAAPPELLDASISEKPRRATATTRHEQAETPMVDPVLSSAPPELFEAIDEVSSSSEHVHSYKRDGQGNVGTDPHSHFDTTNSYYASVSFAKSIGTVWFGHLSDRQLNLIRGQILGARRAGLKARYWATPKWPVSLRNHIWEVLVEEGAEMLNGDDLRGMTRVDWTAKRHHSWLGG